MKKVSIIGAGNVGATAALDIVRMDIVNEVVLLDIKEGVAEGKAMDIEQCASADDFTTIVTGVTNDYSATANSDIIVITSGMPRKPGMTREDLVGVNSRIMYSVASECHKYSPDAIYIIVSNPMDTMTFQVQNILISLGKKDTYTKVFGMGGLLDSSRFVYFIRQALKKHGINAKAYQIIAWVIGGHTDTTMIPLINEADYNGKLITDILSKGECDVVVENTMKGGATLTNLLGTSAWEAPAACIAMTVKSIINNNETLMPCSVYDESIGCAIGTLCKVGENGILKTFMPKYDKELYDKIEESIKAAKKINEVLPKFN